MTAVARRPVLHLVPIAPEPEPVAEPPKPAGKWGPLAEPVNVAETEQRAGWSSFLTRGGKRRDHTDLTDLRGLARAIRATR